MDATKITIDADILLTIWRATQSALRPVVHADFQMTESEMRLQMLAHIEGELQRILRVLRPIDGMGFPAEPEG